MKRAIIGISLVLVLVVWYMYTSRGASTMTVNKEDMVQASKVIIAQLEKEAREALPLNLQANVGGMELSDTVRGEVLAILKQNVVTSNDMLGMSMLGTTDPAPGTKAYNKITFTKVMALSGIGDQGLNKAKLPTVSEDKLLAMMVYSLRRGLPQLAKIHSSVIAYKRVLALGQTIDLDLSEFSPDLGLISPSDIPFASLDIGKLKEFLAAFLFPPDPPLNYSGIINVLRILIEEIEKEEESEAEPGIDQIETSLEEYRAETMAHIASIAGVTSIREIENIDMFDPDLSEDVLLQIEDYALNREDSELSRYATSTLDFKKLVTVGVEIGIDFSVVEPKNVDLESLSVADMAKLENVLKSFTVGSTTLTNFLFELVIVKERKAQEALVSQKLVEEAEAEAQRQAEEQAQHEAEAQAPQQAQEQEAQAGSEETPETPTQQTQQPEEVTEAINNIRTDKTNRVDVEFRRKDNGSMFVDLMVPSDITPTDSDKITIFLLSESNTTLDEYQNVFNKIKSSKSLEGLSVQEISTISSAGVIFADILQSYVRQMTIRVSERVNKI